MKSLKIITVILLVFAWTVQNPAVAQAPVHKSVRFSNTVFALREPKAYARTVLLSKGYSSRQYVCLVKLWNRESHWNYKADNPTSTAYGIGQLLTETSRLPDVQIRNGIRYISYRYGLPCAAWLHWQHHYWY